jgi:signal transduction histidine kinase
MPMEDEVARHRPSAPALAVLACLLAVTVVAAWVTARQTDRREHQLIDTRAGEVAQSVEDRLAAYVEKLYGVRGYLAGSRRVTHRELHDNIVSQELSTRYPGIQVFGIAPLVRDAERDAYEGLIRDGLRRSGLGSYPSFAISPAGRREFYLPISFLEPQRGNQAAFGFDFLTERHRREAALTARATTSPVATAPVRLVQEIGQQRGFLIMLPYYAGGTQRPLVADRSRLFAGVVYAAFRAGDLLDMTLKPLPGNLDVELYDVGRAGGRERRPSAGGLTYNLRGSDTDALDPPDNSRLIPFERAGRRFAVYYATTERLVGSAERAIPWLIGAFGVLVSLLAAGALELAISRRRAATALARQMTADVRLSRNELQRSNEELERFAFLASHDLQQPLRTVSGFLQLLEHQYGDRLDERATEYVTHAVRGTHDMSRLIDDLLEYSRAGRADRPLVPVDLGVAWDGAVGQLRATIEQTEADVRRDQLPIVSADPGQMTQLFANLIGNAVKYRGDAPPVVRGSARRHDGGWEITVQDNGIGIDARDHERIFGMFRRLHSDGRYEGTGVGLALAKRIVERSDGHIRVDSREGEGSRFVVWFPETGPAA